MNIKLRKGQVICVILIIALISIIGLLAYKLQKVEQNNISFNDTNLNKKQELSSNEIQEIEEFLNDGDNNGFIQSEYDNIDDIEWIWVLLCSSIGDTSEDAVQDYCNLMNLDKNECNIPLYKFISEDIISFIKEKTKKLYTINELKSILQEEMVWDKNGEVCFLNTGDAGYDQAINITGYKQEDKYVVKGDYYNPQMNLKTGENVTSFTVTLQKIDNSYIFISNSMK